MRKINRVFRLCLKVSFSLLKQFGSVFNEEFTAIISSVNFSFEDADWPKCDVNDSIKKEAVS